MGNIKTIILSGGYGTRLSEVTETIPKPMVKVGDKPIVCHIMEIYASYGYKDFFLALGHKSEVIKNFFLNYNHLSSDLSIDLKNNTTRFLNKNDHDWNVNLIDTGKSTMTGGRLKRLKDYVNETFFLTYGDGLSDINIQDLLSFHKSHGKLVTVTAVHPVARFGELDLNKDIVKNFSEKPNVNDGWINGGFFVMEPEFLQYISADDTVLEKEPLESLARDNQLMAFRHEGFWQCMDTKRDKDKLNEMLRKKKLNFES